MKKHFLVIIAVLFIGVSAFTMMDGGTKKKMDTEYYFFLVNGLGSVDTTSPLNPVPMTLIEFEGENSQCTPGNNADCVRAWEPGHARSVSGPGEQTIRKQ